MQKKFCLVTEPWIRAMNLQNQVREYSLQEVLCHAQEIRCLTGELSNQDFATLRFLLAVMQTIVYRYQPDGTRVDITDLSDPEVALKRWKALWNMGYIPEEMMAPYFAEWEDRFWLYHPLHPFYQIPSPIDGKPGTAISPGRLIGAVGESDNKSRIFSTYSTTGKRGITDAELTRWILHFQGFDTKATKNSRGPLAPGQEKMHPRICWCGNLGAVYIEGNNLFETIMLNLVLLRTDMEEDACFAVPTPSWERDFYDCLEDHVREDIDNQADLLSLPCRWLYMTRSEDSFSLKAVVGETVEPKNAFMEQMTLWRPIYQKTKEGMELDGYMPSLADPSRNSIPDRTNYGRGLWARFTGIVSTKEDARQPGIILWVKKLMDHGILPEDMQLTVKGIDTVYHKQQGSAVLDLKGNAMDIRLSLLSAEGKPWKEMLETVVELTNKTAELFGGLYVEANEATGHGYDGDTFDTRFEGAELLYGAIDADFRKWLSKVDSCVRAQNAQGTSAMAPDALQKEWEKTLFRTADRCAREKIMDCGASAVKLYESATSRSGFTGLASSYDKFWFSVRKLTDHALDPMGWNIRPSSNRARTVRDYVHNKIARYQECRTDPAVIQEMAKLRRCAGRKMKEVSDVCDLVLEGFPEEYRSEYEHGYTKAERAVFEACVLYAGAHHGDTDDSHLEGESFGRSVRRAGMGEDGKEDSDELKKLVKHFNRMLLADSLELLMLHAVALSRITGKKLRFDYGQFAYDLFTFQIKDYHAATILSWSADFLRNRRSEPETGEETEQ